MGAKSGIEWTDDTWNVSVGCTLVSPGCINCYAMGAAAGVLRKMQGSAARPTKQPSEKTEAAIQLYKGVTRLTKPGKNDDCAPRPVWTEKVNLCGDEVLNRPLHWKKPRRVFVNSMSDLFHEDIPNHFIEKVFWIMGKASQHQFQVLTKRPARAAEILNRIYHFGTPPNVWIGTSAEDARRLEERVPELLKIKPRPAVLFLSAEPLLESLLGPAKRREVGVSEYGRKLTVHDNTDWENRRFLLRSMDWVIVGGESGPRARPMNWEWVREIADVCAIGGTGRYVTKKTAFFFKQWGEFNSDGKRVGKRKPGGRWTERNLASFRNEAPPRYRRQLFGQKAERCRTCPRAVAL